SFSGDDLAAMTFGSVNQLRVQLALGRRARFLFALQRANLLQSIFVKGSFGGSRAFGGHPPQKQQPQRTPTQHHLTHSSAAQEPVKSACRPELDFEFSHLDFSVIGDSPSYPLPTEPAQNRNAISINLKRVEGVKQRAWDDFHA